MLYLTELSIPVRDVRETARKVEPLAAADPGYALKAWMESLDLDVQPRPWTWQACGDVFRVLGWRAEPPARGAGSLYTGFRTVTFDPGETVSLEGTVVALRRTRRYVFDAAEHHPCAKSAYDGWLTERLIDVRPFADIEHAGTVTYRARKVLRKAARRAQGIKVVHEQRVPVVTAALTLTVRDPAGVERWLLKGTGPQKAFGFGSFLPC